MNDLRQTIKIGIDGRYLANISTGIGRYITELCRALDELMKEARFYVYTLKPPRMLMPSERWTVRSEPSAIAQRLFMASTMTLPWFRYRVGKLCKSDDIGVFWGTQSFLPLLTDSIRSVITIYDLNLIIARETMNWRSIAGHRLLLKRSLAESKGICTISHGTAARLRNLLGYKTDAVIKPCVSTQFTRRPEPEISACLRHYGIEPPYLMGLGTWEPRKNLAMLVETFTRMKVDGLLTDYSLVLVGGRGWKDTKLTAMVHSAAATDVRSLGYVSDEDLPALYSGCAAFVFPSIYEGFGIPVLEARACGTRVIATDIPEIREAGGDDTIYVTPTSNGLRAGIMHALQQPGKLPSLSSNSNTWKQSAAEFAKLLLDIRG